MTYRVEITAGSLSELGGKLLALASQFQTTAAEPVLTQLAADDAEKPAKAKTTKTKPAKETTPEPAETAAPEAEQPAKEEVGNAPAASTVEAPSPTSSSEPDTRTVENAPAPSEPASLDFDKDIAPLVLRVVSEKGRDVAIEILSQFGVTRASEVEEARWGELHNVLTDAL